MIHAMCDFCGKDAGNVGYFLTITPFQNHGNDHMSHNPFGHVDETFSAVVCQECYGKALKLPNPYEQYAKTCVVRPLEKTFNNYTYVDIVSDDESEKGD